MNAGFYMAIAYPPLPPVQTVSTDMLDLATLRKYSSDKPLFNPATAERERCVAILHKLIAEHIEGGPDEEFATNRLKRAISQIEGGR